MAQDTPDRRKAKDDPSTAQTGGPVTYSLAQALSAVSAQNAQPLPGNGPPPLSQVSPDRSKIPALPPILPTTEPTSLSPPSEDPTSEGPDTATQSNSRRTAKRRPAGPARASASFAANDDVPTIGGLIYALEQRPSRQPFRVAGIASAIWVVTTLAFSAVIIFDQVSRGAGLWQLVAQPTLLAMTALILLPPAIFYFLAMLVWRAQELKLMSSAMTEVAVRLAEPDRHAEQQVTSLGQTVRKQLGFMTDAVNQAVSRAGELEAMVHSEVTTLERSFKENEERIRKVLGELASERTQLVSTSGDVHATLRAMGDEVPALIEKLNGQQGKLARIIESAGQNLIALESSLLKASDKLEGSLVTVSDKIEGSLLTATDKLENSLSDRTTHLQQVLDGYAGAINDSLGQRTSQLQQVLDEYTGAINAALGHRTSEMQGVLIDATQSLDSTLVERTRALDSAFAERLTEAMTGHARHLAETLSRQSHEIDENLMHGIDAVRRTSENITRQSVKAIEGLSGQADMLRNVSENLLTQIGSVTSRFENQGQSIMRAANALETANFRIDSTLQQRHRDLNETLTQLTGKAESLDGLLKGYSNTVEGGMSAAEAHTQRALVDMQSQFSTVGKEIDTQMGSLSSRLAETSDTLRQQTRRATQDLLAEQERLRAEAERLPAATRDSTEAMRRVLNDQIRALDKLTALSSRQAARRDVMPPAAPPVSLTSPAQQPPLHQAPHTTPAGQQPSQASARWTLGELLSRADAPTPHPPSGNNAHPPHPPSGFAPPQTGEAPNGGQPINLEVIAGALDQDTASALWSRYRAGQRGIMVRSIYSPEGRETFDEVTRRYASDATFRGTVDKFLADFEALLRDSEQRDPSGRTSESHLVSPSGRTYLFLAHAAGRIN